MARTTPATKALDALGIAYEFDTFEYTSGPDIGARAAAEKGVEPGQVMKTLMIKVDGKPACLITPSDGNVSLKKAAAAFGGKSAAMMPIPEAERATGYVVGGISPLGQRKRAPTAINERAFLFERIYVNGGGRGTLVYLTPDDLKTAAEAIVAELD